MIDKQKKESQNLPPQKSWLMNLVLRELLIIRRNNMYWFCMVVFPLLTLFFFTTLMDDGLPMEMPVGVVDHDNTSTTRTLVRRLDGMQSSHVVAYYPAVNNARKAMQQGDIYGFIYFPKGTTDDLLANRQPKISYFFTYTSLTAGSLVMKDLKTVSTLGSAAFGQSVLQAKGASDELIQTLLQPIRIDLHQIANPWGSYNSYLTTTFVPGLFILFIFLISAYSIGNEMKFNTSHQWMEMANGNMLKALTGKFLPQTLIWLAVVFFYQWYVFFHLGFPHQGSPWMLVLLGLMQVLAAQGFGIFAFGLMPSLRMSMSICSLWGVLSMSMAGSAFPVMGMDGPLQSLSWFFPLRHYFMVYQTCVFNGYPLHEAWFHFVALGGFMLLPWMVIGKLKNAMLNYVYIP